MRITTDRPETNFHTILNYAYAENGRVMFRYADGEEGVDLCSYIARHAQKDFHCDVSPDDVMNGDDCVECDCPLAILNTVATQAAELRVRLKSYEDAEEKKKIVKLPVKIGDEVWCIRNVKGKNVSQNGIVHEMFFNEAMELIIVARYVARGIFGEKVFLTKEEADAAIRRKYGK